MDIKLVLEVLKREHEEIEKNLKEFENLFQERINYERILEVFNRLVEVWYNHEEKENELLKSKLKSEESQNFILEHESIRGHSTIIQNALNTEDRHYISVVMDTDGKMLCDRLRNHMEKENRVFETITV